MTDESASSSNRLLPVGRTLRVLLGFLLLASIARFYLDGDWRLVLAALGVAAGLAATYVLAHWLVWNFLPHVPGWLGALLALGPLVLVYLLGAGGGLIFGRGEGQLGALTFLGASLLLAGWRADPGCEVMSIPNALLGRRTHLACLFFSPLDWLERRVFGGRR